MLNADGQPPNPTHPAAARKLAVDHSSLSYWIHQVIEQGQARIKVRLQGNNLHVLCESEPSPNPEVIIPRLKKALAIAPFQRLLSPGSPQIHRIIVYGRLSGQAEPTWTKTLDLNWRNQLAESKLSNPQISRHPAPSIDPEGNPEGNPEGLSEKMAGREGTMPETPSTPNLARQEQQDAIAHYLSNALSKFDVAVRVKIRPTKAEEVDLSSPSPVETRLIASLPARLLIICESAYTPDPALLAEPIAQHLRELELNNVQDAVVLGQVNGETRPEWMLRVDLTPPDEILKEWARWGDVQAIARLLNLVLSPQQMEVSALLKDATLHLSCAGMKRTVPDKLTAIGTIIPLLQSFTPQGILAAILYGVPSNSEPLSDTARGWVQCLDLPASTQPTLAKTTLDLARQGNLKAINFLLTRLLNPDLDAMLATGGVRVQIRQKGDLLHIMTEAPNCPRQDAVAPAIVRFLKPLQITSVSGVRVYGRRSGQKQPLWSYGVDFVSRSQVVAEATPEFVVSAVHVDDLLAPPGAIVLWSELPADDWRSVLQLLYGSMLERVQRSLVRTQLFIPSESSALNEGMVSADASLPVSQSNRQKVAIAALWGSVGLLLVLQSDWMLGSWMQSAAPKEKPAPPLSLNTPPSPAPSLTAKIPNQSLSQSKSQNWSGFNSSGFTQPDGPVIAPTESEPSTAAENSSENPTGTAILPAAPLQAKAETLGIQPSEYPSFNSRQLDGQIALYQRYLEMHGVPDVLVIGSSRALRGVDPATLEKALAEQGYSGVQIFNFGINGATAQVVDWLVRQVLPQDRVPKLILFADGARAFNSGRLDITFNGIAASEGYRTLMAGKPAIPGAVATAQPSAKPQAGQPTSVTEESPASTIADRYRSLNDELNKRLASVSLVYAQRDRLRTKLLEQVASLLPKGLSSSADVIASSDSLLNASSPSAAAATSSGSLTGDSLSMIDIDGFLPLSVRFNPTTYYQKYARVLGDYDSDYESFGLEGSQTDALTALAQYARSRQIPLVFVNLPLTKEYLDPARKRHEDEFQQHMLQLAPQLGMVYRDLSGALTTQPDHFSDPSHLNRYGAYEVSRRLAQDAMIPWQTAR
ncbi:MAG: DUF1574 domain-containing protein [Leptolyngbyaceae cyanobacterium RU_5_1]|nr:DUF1574 domain-containing protein [Leptolyngbyaceae cyanobacterium RU_5_1]